MKDVVLFGAGGQLGRELAHRLARDWKVHPLTRDQCDITDKTSVTRTLDTIRPNVIINAAAYTAVDKAEIDEATALSVNAEAAGFLAEAARRTDAFFLSYSSDYVFDGKTASPYDELAIPQPLNVYGRSKAAGEQAIRAAGGRHLIVRTAWLYGRGPEGFLSAIIRRTDTQERLDVVCDQFGSPTSANWLANVSAQLIETALRDPAGNDALDIVHAVCSGQASWYEFARAILAAARDRGAPNRTGALHPIRTADYPASATRPKHSVLSVRRLRQHWRIHAPPWQEALRKEIDAILGARSGDVG